MGFTKLWTLEYFSTVSFGTITLFQKLLGLKLAISCKKKILIRNIFEGHFRSICTQATRLLSGTVGVEKQMTREQQVTAETNDKNRKKVPIWYEGVEKGMNEWEEEKTQRETKGKLLTT